jgi:hypothetical protein
MEMKAPRDVVTLLCVIAIVGVLAAILARM